MNKSVKKAIETQLESIDECLKGVNNDYSGMRVCDIQDLDMLLWALLEGDWNLVVSIFMELDEHVRQEFLAPPIFKYIESEIHKIIQDVMIEQRERANNQDKGLPPNG